MVRGCIDVELIERVVNDVAAQGCRQSHSLRLKGTNTQASANECGQRIAQLALNRAGATGDAFPGNDLWHVVANNGGWSERQQASGMPSRIGLSGLLSRRQFLQKIAGCLLGIVLAERIATDDLSS